VKTQIFDSARARPARYGGRGDDESSNQRREESARLIQSGLHPDIVGERVLEAIKAGELYIFTHPEMKAAVDARFEAINAGFKHAEESQALKGIKNTR